MEKEMFEELKQKCLVVRGNYKDRPGDYYEKKVNYVNSINNPKDFYILINMFDLDNTRKLWNELSESCRNYYEDYFVKILTGSW